MGVGHLVDASVGPEEFDEDVEGLAVLAACAFGPLGEYGGLGDVGFGKLGEELGCGSGFRVEDLF